MRRPSAAVLASVFAMVLGTAAAVVAEPATGAPSAATLLATLQQRLKLTKPYAVARGFEAPLTAAEREGGATAKLVIELTGPLERQALGYRLHRDPAAAAAAFPSHSMANEPELGVDSVRASEVMLTPKGTDQKLKGTCEVVPRADPSAPLIARCAALFQSMIVTAAGTTAVTPELQKRAELFGSPEIAFTTTDLSALLAAAVAAAVDAGR